MDGRYESRENYVDVPSGTQVRFLAQFMWWVKKRILLSYVSQQCPSKDIRRLFDASGIRSL